MKIGEDYVLAFEKENDWSVILNQDPWRDTVVKYHNIQILEKATKLSFQHEILFNPTDAETSTEEFEDHIAAILDSVIRHFHDQGTIQYANKETGEIVNV